MDMQEAQQATISIYDIMGREVYHNISNSGYQHKINIDNFKSGIYYLNMQAGFQNYLQKLIIY